MNMYYGDFQSWHDVCREFQVEVPEPDEVLLALYDQPAYEGYADVIYRVGDRYFWVTASHCSCYGLEGQWEPEEYSRDLLRGALERGLQFYSLEDGEGARLRQSLLDRLA
jgi:hypothetical protein